MLQGSLENFALDEVLGLLSGTSKTGQLEIAGNRGTGNLVFHEGRLVDGSASFTANGIELEDVMFELLRYDDGTFTFTHRDVTTGEIIENVSSVLANAEARLKDWRGIELVVPSLSHQVVPVLELPSDEVTVSRDEWATLMTVGTGCPASHVCERLSLGEVEGSRRIKDLAERMLVNVTEPVGSYRRAQGTAAPATGSSSSSSSVTGSSPSTGSVAGNGSSTPTTAPEPAPAVASVNAADHVSETASTLEALAGGPAAAGETAERRPPMPPVPTAEDLSADGAVPPGPPSPSEIAGFGEGVDDASELLETVDDGKGGILARYLRGED